MSNNPLDLDAMAQAELVANGKISASELVDAAISQIEKHDSKINAITQQFFDDARHTAKKNSLSGPFSGVPFLVKDFYCHIQGKCTTASSLLLKDNMIDHDSELMSRYRKSGLVTLGKTNVPEMVTMGTTEPKLTGATRNPWNLNHTSGGSSGGAAAAVAVRYVPVAHANDGAGSTRIPASCCGLFGLKPSRGRITLGPDIGESIGGITAEHVVSRSVRDSAAMLDATAGGLAGDPYIAPQPNRNFLDEVANPRKGLCIAVSHSALYEATLDAECVTAVDKAAQLCIDLGHDVEFVSPEVNGEIFRQSVEAFWPMTVARAISGLAMQRGCSVDLLVKELEPFNQYLFSKGINRKAVDYIQDLVWFQGLTRTLGGFLDTYDIWLTPTLPFAPPKLGFFDAEIHGGEEAYRRVIDSFAFTVAANVAGLPAASIPMAWTQNNLPIGVQVTARQNDEAVLFNLAAQIEKAQPWMTRQPTMNQS